MQRVRWQNENSTAAMATAKNEVFLVYNIKIVI